MQENVVMTANMASKEKEEGSSALSENVNEREKRSDDVLRSSTSLLVFAVLVVLGLPLWWFTTTVYRAALPVEQIAALSSKELLVKVPLLVVVDSRLTSQSKTLLRILEEQLQDSSRKQLVPQFKFNIIQLDSPNIQKTLEGGGAVQDVHRSLSATEEGRHLVVFRDHGGDADDHSHDTVAWLVGRVLLVDVIDDVKSAVSAACDTLHQVLIQQEAAAKAFESATAKRQHTKKADIPSMRAVTATSGYRLAFTLVNSDPAFARVEWAIRQAVQDYLQPFLNGIESLAEFSVDSQVLYYTGGKLRPRRRGDVFVITEEQLPHMVNPLESALGSHSSRLTDLQFLVFVPPSHQSPLFIQKKDGKLSESNAFLVHRWGGIVIYNINSANVTEVDGRKQVTLKMPRVMATFISQLRLLLGIAQPTVPKGLATVKGTSTLSLSAWEWDNVLLSRTVENVAQTTSTLQSLIQLLDEVQNMVIADHIQKQVNLAVASVDEARKELRHMNLSAAYRASQTALAASEEAFFDPSMLALLYFPEDTKYAIYVPLFLPMALPVLVSFLQSVRLLRTLHRKGQDKEKLE